jgi:hypothetical protein
LPDIISVGGAYYMIGHDSTAGSTACFYLHKDNVNQLSSYPKPDFIDHFPRTSAGHGRVPRFRKVGDQYFPTKAKPCAQVTCQLNMRGNGEKHQAGAADGAAAWMRHVHYNGPSPGISAEKEREARRDDVVFGPKHHCHHKCTQVGVHSICILDAPFRVQVGEQMAERVGRLTFRTKDQEANRLAEYLGVERRWRS